MGLGYCQQPNEQIAAQGAAPEPSAGQAQESNAAAAEALAPRVVQGAGGYVYQQAPDGTITILDGPTGRGCVLTSGPAFDAITAEIGPFPAPGAQPALPGSGDGSWIDDPVSVDEWLWGEEDGADVGGGEDRPHRGGRRHRGEEGPVGEDDPYLDQNDNQTETVTQGPGKGGTKAGSSQCTPTSTAMVILAEIGAESMRTAAESLWGERGHRVAPGAFRATAPEHLVWEYVYLRTADQWSAIVGHGFSMEIHKYSSVMAHVIEEFTDHPAATLPSGEAGLRQLEHLPVVAGTNLTSSGHTVEVTEVDGNGITVNDPYGAKTDSEYLVNGRTGSAPPAPRWSENPDLQAADPRSEARSDWGRDNRFTWDEVERWDIAKWVVGVQGERR